MRTAVLALLCVACGGAPAAPAAPARDAWPRVLELIDLFDRARFAPDPAARARVLAALGVPLAGAAARTTDAALDALLVEVDRVLAADRLHAAAGAARALLEIDRRPPADRAGLLSATVALKGVARGGGPLAPNATLRLAGMCDRAFLDAAAAPPRRRPLLLATCLYPLWDADPEPYFAPEPARRPPPPAWTELQARLLALLGQAGRLADVAAALRARHEARVAGDAKRGLLPQPLDPRALGVPLVAGAAEPYDWQPLVVVKDPSPAELAAFEGRLVALLETEDRAAVAVRADAPARQLLDVAALARRLGAAGVDLVVGYEQAVRAPPGDYWHERAPEGRVPRAGVLPLRLDAADLGPRAALGLRVVVAPRSWQVASPAGAMPAIAIGDDPAPAAAALRAQLAELLDAFPDEGALVVVPDPEVTVAALAQAIRAVPPGVALALDRERPRVVSRDLAARAARRSAARVTLVPDALAARAPAVRRCWQDAVERRVAAGTLALELAGRSVRPVAGPADEALRRCVIARLEEPMVAAGITSARVELVAR